MNSSGYNRQGMFNSYAENILPCWYWIWSSMWGWSKICSQNRRIIFQDNGRFSEKPIRSLFYWVQRLRMSKIYWDWCLLGNDLAFRDFCQRKFLSFFVGGSVRWNFRKLLGYQIEFISRKGIFYLLVFIDIQNSCFWPCLPNYNLKSEMSFRGMWISCIFAWYEYIWFSWIRSLFLEIFHFCCLCDTLICVKNHPLNTFRWLQVRGYATTYFWFLNLGVEPFLLLVLSGDCRWDSSYLTKWSAL